jgi:hypothetical protein
LNYFEAHNLLDKIRHGHNAPQFLINKALELTGDLSCGALCEDGTDRGSYRSSSVPSQRTGGKRDWDVGRARQSSGETNQGVAS